MKIETLCLLLTLIPLAIHDTAIADNNATEQIIDRQLFKAGRAKAQGCTRCHGGRGIERLAINAGWTDGVGSFVQNGLTAFRDGTRVNNIMSNIAKNLTDKDINEISYWLDAIAKK